MTDDKLWGDLTTDAERLEYLRSGKAAAHGIIAMAVIPDITTAYGRIAELENEVERYRRIHLSEIAAQTRKVYTGQAERIRQLKDRIVHLEQQLQQLVKEVKEVQNDK